MAVPESTRVCGPHETLEWRAPGPPTRPLEVSRQPDHTPAVDADPGPDVWSTEMAAAYIGERWLATAARRSLGHAS
jgi:hypothetical protein